METKEIGQRKGCEQDTKDTEGNSVHPGFLLDL